LKGKSNGTTADIPYKTGDRHHSFPVPDLNVEVAAFVYPVKKDFTEFLQLCEAKPSNFIPMPGDWKITQDRQTKVSGCTLVRPPVSKCKHLGCDTNGIMNPTQLFSFNHSIPVNHKWVHNGLFNDAHSPEYLIDTSTVYYFDYTEDNLETGHQWVMNAKEGGDFDQNLEKVEFSGEMDFIGRSASTNSKFYLYPANAPILNFEVLLDANKTLTNELVKQIGEQTAIGWDLNTVHKFSPISLKWPNFLPLTIQPGYNYTFKASIYMQPVYDVGILGGYTLSKWEISADTTFEKVRWACVNNNCANVRLQVSFVRDSSVLENRVIYSLFDFFSNLGSSVGIFSIGIVFLSAWQALTIHPQVLKYEEADNDSNPYTDQDFSSSSRRITF
jgi:hypothetical protein